MQLHDAGQPSPFGPGWPILDYMQKHHYVLVGKYVRVDGMNLYFMPEGAPGPHIPAPKALSGEGHAH